MTQLFHLAQLAQIPQPPHLTIPAQITQLSHFAQSDQVTQLPHLAQLAQIPQPPHLIQPAQITQLSHFAQSDQVTQLSHLAQLAQIPQHGVACFRHVSEIRIHVISSCAESSLAYTLDEKMDLRW